MTVPPRFWIWVDSVAYDVALAPAMPPVWRISVRGDPGIEIEWRETKPLENLEDRAAAAIREHQYEG